MRRVHSNIKLRTAGEISSGKGDDVAGRPPSLGTQEDLLFLNHPGTERRPFPTHHTGPAAAAGILGVKSRRPLPWFLERDLPCILLAGLQNIGRGPPLSLGHLGKIPGVAFPAGKIASGLIDGEIVFGS